MANNYTQAQINAVLGAVPSKVFYNNIELGVLAPDSVTVTFNGNTEGFGSSMTGDGGHIGIISDGTTATVTATLRNFDKYVLNAIAGYRFDEGSTATNSSTPFVGALIGISQPSLERGAPLVIYPAVYDNNAAVQYTDSTANKLTFLFPKAVLTGDIEIPFSTSDVTDIELEFTCLVDPTQNPPRLLIIDDGITSAGVYTP